MFMGFPPNFEHFWQFFAKITFFETAKMKFRHPSKHKESTRGLLENNHGRRMKHWLHIQIFGDSSIRKSRRFFARAHNCLWCSIRFSQTVVGAHEISMINIRCHGAETLDLRICQKLRGRQFWKGVFCTSADLFSTSTWVKELLLDLNCFTSWGPNPYFGSFSKSPHFNYFTNFSFKHHVWLDYCQNRMNINLHSRSASYMIKMKARFHLLVVIIDRDWPRLEWGRKMNQLFAKSSDPLQNRITICLNKSP
jgi:hypothetical protein